MLFDISEVGVDRVEHLVEGMARRVTNPRGAADDILDELVDAERDLFASGGKGLWEEIAPATVERRRRRGSSGSRPLRDTDKLMASLTRRHGPGSIQSASRSDFRFGTSVPHAKYQRRTRPPVIIDRPHRRRAAAALLDHIVGRDR